MPGTETPRSKLIGRFSAMAHASSTEPSPGSGSSLRLPRLPACHTCAAKKIKCDNERPSCANCSRHGTRCAVWDSITDRLVLRSYVHELEQRQMNKARRQSSTVNATATPASTEADNEALSLVGSSTVMNRGGLSFLSLLFSDPHWRQSNAGLLRELTESTKSSERTHHPCPLPSRQDSQVLFETYLKWSHLQSAFLLRREVWELQSRVYAALESDQVIDSTDLFRTFMICAIASVMPYRNGAHAQHPEGYYLSALRHLDHRLLTRGLRSIEDLLLVCRYGIYENIGTSIWDVIRLCGRLCVELGLHISDGPPGTPPLERQRRRRVFWQLYLVDRYSSTTLDRPFAIDDQDIRIDMPLNANDEDLVYEGPDGTFQSLETSVGSTDPSSLTETTIFILSVKLRQVSSHIHTEFCRLREECVTHSQLHLTIGRIYMTLENLLGELGAWRASAPVIDRPTCLYESQKWYDLLYAREKLYLIRRAVDLLPRRGGVLPRYFSSLLLNAALRVIEQYAAMSRDKAVITHTRNYFHMMFTAGLSVIVCISSSTEISQRELVSSAQGLRACEDTITDMGDMLPYAQGYVTIFTALHGDVSRKIKKALRGSGNASQAPTAPSSPKTGTNGLSAAGLASSSTQPLADVTVTDERLGGFGVIDNPYDIPYSSESTGTYRYDNNIAGLSQLVPSARMEAVVDKSIPLIPPFAGDGIASIGPDEGSTSDGGDLLQWAFMDDFSLWNMDTMLWEHVEGHPNSGSAIPSGLADMS